MKKFIFMMIAMLTLAIGANAQSTSNYAGSSKFTDNWEITLQGGVVTPASHFFADGSVTPVVVLGVDKYVTPWLGFGVEGRTSIGTGDEWNLHTAFDQVNVSGYGKVNLANLFAFNGSRRFFEPVVYTGLGWGHQNCSNALSIHSNYAVNGVPTENLGQIRNYLTYRAGVELNFNLGKTKAWGIVVNPSFVWGNVDNFRLTKDLGNFELAAGVVYYFKTSNGTHSYAKAHLYDQVEIDALNARIAELQNRPVVTNAVEKVVEKTVEKTVAINPDSHFAYNESIVDPTSESVLDEIATEMKSNSANYTVTGYASVEGDDAYNQALSQKRADAVKQCLVDRGVSADRITAVGAGETEKFGNTYEPNRRVTVAKN